tara:strand:+ start:323 stop:526 length:204 start_codon:yes stop_codon:yes gene_type:complete
MNLKTGQDLPLNLADRLRNLAVVRSFFMVGKDSPPTPLWKVLLLIYALSIISVAIVHVWFNLLSWGL